MTRSRQKPALRWHHEDSACAPWVCIWGAVHCRAPPLPRGAQPARARRCGLLSSSPSSDLSSDRNSPLKWHNCGTHSWTSDHIRSHATQRHTRTMPLTSGHGSSVKNVYASLHKCAREQLNVACKRTQNCLSSRLIMREKSYRRQGYKGSADCAYLASSCLFRVTSGIICSHEFFTESAYSKYKESNPGGKLHYPLSKRRRPNWQSPSSLAENPVEEGRGKAQGENLEKSLWKSALRTQPGCSSAPTPRSRGGPRHRKLGRSATHESCPWSHGCLVCRGGCIFC